MIKKSDKKSIAGFTLVEALVSIAVMTIIMSVVIFNYSGFNDRLALTSAGQEVAMAIREAQTYGVAGRQAAPNVFNSAYGVLFNKDDPTNYYIFVDKDNDQVYDVGTGCGSSGTECVEKVSFRNGVKISDICNDTSCPPNVNAKILSVTFMRPSLSARIYFKDSSGVTLVGPSTVGKVKLISPKGSVLSVSVSITGQIFVDNTL